MQNKTGGHLSVVNLTVIVIHSAGGRTGDTQHSDKWENCAELVDQLRTTYQELKNTHTSGVTPLWI